MPGYTGNTFSYPMGAGGNINPCVFITLSTAPAASTVAYTSNRLALQAGTAARTIGITGEGTEQAPQSGYATYHATSGNPLGDWFGNGYAGGDALVVVGSTAVTANDLLQSDTNGNAVTCTVSGTWYGAMALESANPGEKVPVVLINGYHA